MEMTKDDAFEFGRFVGLGDPFKKVSVLFFLSIRSKRSVTFDSCSNPSYKSEWSGRATVCIAKQDRAIMFRTDWALQRIPDFEASRVFRQMKNVCQKFDAYDHSVDAASKSYGEFS